LSRKYWLLVAALARWEIVAKLKLIDEAFVPSFFQTLPVTRELWERAFLFTHVMVSLSRVLIALLLALVLAVPLGYVFGRLLPKLAKTLEPLLRVFGLINPYCLFPLFVVFFGAGETPKIAVLLGFPSGRYFFRPWPGSKTSIRSS
jgi:NitT/TauT family transport system permease protein